MKASISSMKLLNGAKARPAQRFGRKNAKPDFDLIEPGSVRGGKMKMNHRMRLAPLFLFHPVHAQIIQDHMQFLARVGGNQPVHEGQEFDPALALEMAAEHLAGDHVERREKRAGAVTLGQDEASSVVYGMPKAAWDMGAVQQQHPIRRMGAAVLRAALIAPARAPSRRVAGD